jgi:hypothetical protein
VAEPLTPIAELRQHAEGYCGEGATPKCFARMRDLIDEIENGVKNIREKVMGCDCVPGQYCCVLHEALALLP